MLNNFQANNQRKLAIDLRQIVIGIPDCKFEMGIILST